MSRIYDLIADLCPNGVHHKPMGEVGKFIRGSGLQKKDLRAEGTPAIHYGQVHTHYGIWSTETISFVDEGFGRRLRHAQPGDVILATTSEDDEAVGKAMAWLGEEAAAVSGDAFIYRHTLDPKYVSYFLNAQSFQDQKARYITGAKVRRISGASLAKIRIPVPPLEVQQEIVRILDKFTQLAAELGAELEARQKQYSFYQTLLTGSLHAERHVKLGEVAQYSKTRVEASDLDETTFVGVDNLLDKNRGRINATHMPNTDRLTEYLVGDVLIGNIRPYLRKTWRADRNGGCSGDVLAVQVRDDARCEIDSRYLYHVLASDGFLRHNMRHAKGAKMPRGDRSAVMKYEFPLPSMGRQGRIADTLDKFDTLVNDISSGLPAEIAARRKQYEYYRDKLLTFEELPA